MVEGVEVPNYIANVRTDNNAVLGVVGKRYNIIQNTDAFSFIDGMVDEGMKFTMANTSSDNKKTWILGELMISHHIFILKIPLMDQEVFN